jgi:hypothetical protein
MYLTVAISLVVCISFNYPGNQLSWLRLFLAFSLPPRKSPGQFLQLGHGRFLPQNLTYLCCVVWAVDSILNSSDLKFVEISGSQAFWHETLRLVFKKPSRSLQFFSFQRFGGICCLRLQHRSITLTMEAADFSGPLVTTCLIALHHNLEDHSLNVPWKMTSNPYPIRPGNSNFVEGTH